MTTQRLTNDLIANPSLVRLYLRLGPDTIDVMLYNPYEEQSLIHECRSLRPADNDGADTLHALENFIYDNPLLLNAEFHSTHIIVDSPQVRAIPPQAPHAEELLRLSIPELLPDQEIFTEALTTPAITLAWSMPADLLNFLRRTLTNATLSHSLTSLLRYSWSKSSGSQVKAWIDMHPQSIDVVVQSQASPAIVSRIGYAHPNDAAFYILSAIEASNRQVDEIYIAGDGEQRREVVDVLRRFHPYVMPMVFPSEMHRAGARVGTIPFDLLILPLLA